MKKFLLLFILLINSFAFGQAQYKVDLSNLSYRVYRNVKNKTSSHLDLRIYFEDGTYETAYYSPIRDNSTISNFNFTTTTTKKPIRIWYDLFVNFSSTNDIRNTFDINLNLCPSSQNIFDKKYDGMDMYFRYNVTPIHNLKNEIINGLPNTYLPYDSKVKLLDVEGFSPELYHYQYNISDENGNITESNWQDIESSLYDKHILNISGKDFFGNNYKQYLGRKIYFRVVSCFENGDYLSKSNSVFLTFILSAPKIISASFEDITCFGEENGQVTLNFDRKLEEGETLEGSLVNVDTGGVRDNYNLSSLSNVTSYTISGLEKGNYRLDLAQGTYGGNPTYTDGADYSYTFTIKEPKPVEFSVTQSTDVFCFDGADGTISLSATGEAGRTFKYSILGGNFTTDNWVDFSSASTTKIENLPAGEYTIKVMDSSGCLAKNGDTIKEVKVKITQPDAPLSVVENEIMLQQPTGYGLSNGLISVRIVGGTKNDDGSYNFEWRKDSPSGEIISSSQIVTDATNNPFTIVLKDIPSGKYYLTVKDRNYSNALDGQEGCGIISREFFVDQPLPLVAKLSVKEEILCHIENEYYGNFDRDNNNIPDQAETGIIQSEVSGGVGSYKYQWYKNDNGSFIILQNETSAELSKIIAGEYKLEVVDENKNKTETELIINSPEKLIVNTEANELICNSDNGGVITATAIGGSGDYTYLWNTSDITSTVTGLTAGNYFVTIKDKNNCVATNSVTIKEPSSFEVEVVQQINPTCFGQANGLLEISISGGTYPYLIEWSNGMKGALISGLKAGEYIVTITDESGCQTIKTYMLTEPEETKVNLGKDVTLCLGDSIDYDVTSTDANATYEWLDKNGNIISTSAKISLNLPGEYTVKITNESGCVSTDSVIITSSSAILQPEFLIATHGFVDGNVKLVNSSKIIPERVEWIFPSENDYKIISESTESLEIKFSKIGKYQFGLKGYQGLCEKTFYKEILVEENTNGIDINPKSISNIKEFIVTPNPNNGNYKVFVKLYEAKPIRIRIIDMLAQEFYVSSEFIKNTEFEIPFHQSLVSGAYFVVLETEGEILVRRMLIK